MNLPLCSIPNFQKTKQTSPLCKNQKKEEAKEQKMFNYNVEKKCVES
jgi:hypothetical protein